MFHIDFAEWFSGSVVVDDLGNPKRVYHGTYREFDRLSGHAEANSGARRGTISFTDNPAVAEGYASYDRRWEELLRIQEAAADAYRESMGGANEHIAYQSAMRAFTDYTNEYRAAGNVQSGANIWPCALSIKNPLTFDAAGHNWERLMGNAYTDPKLSAHDLVAQAISEGRDGVVLLNVVDPAWGFVECLIPATTYIIFSDDQARPWYEAALCRV